MMNDHEISNEDKKGLALSYMRELANHDLVAFLTEALEPRRVHKVAAGDFWDESYAVARAFYTKDAPVEIELLATGYEPDNPYSSPGRIPQLTELGMCDVCGVSVLSCYKLARCPVCSNKVECT